MIVIDGITYNIPYVAVKRKAELLFKFAERTQDGVLHSQLIGVYYNFSLQFGMSINDIEDYAALWVKVTEPVENHTVTLPNEDGGLTFDAYFAGISDEVSREDTPSNFFRNLAFDVIATSPARTP